MANERVVFRPGPMFDTLKERADEPSDAAISRVAQRDLGRYYDALALALAQVELDEGEAMLIVDILNGTVIDLTVAQMLHYEVADSLPDGMAEKWGVDGAALVAKIGSYSLLQRLAIVDAVERWWGDSYHVDDSRARLLRVGLVHGKV